MSRPRPSVLFEVDLPSRRDRNHSHLSERACREQAADERRRSAAISRRVEEGQLTNCPSVVAEDLKVVCWRAVLETQKGELLVRERHRTGGRLVLGWDTQSGKESATKDTRRGSLVSFLAAGSNETHDSESLEVDEGNRAESDRSRSGWKG